MLADLAHKQQGGTMPSKRDLWDIAEQYLPNESLRELEQIFTGENASIPHLQISILAMIDARADKHLLSPKDRVEASEKLGFTQTQLTHLREWLKAKRATEYPP